MVKGLIGYDLPAESQPGLAASRKTFRNTMRKRILTHCNEKFDSEPIQDSLWLLKDCDPHKIIDQLNDWNQEYHKRRDQSTFFFVELPEHINIIWIGKKRIRGEKVKGRRKKK
jgi:hypothetical protein